MSRALPGGLIGAGALALLLTASAARASCCLFDDPLRAIGEVAARSGDVRLAVDVEALSSGAAMDPDGAAMVPMEEEVRQTTLRAVAVYSPVERLNLVAAVPLVRREWRVQGGETPGGFAVRAGLGDVDVGARVALWREVEFVQDPVRIAVARVQAVAISAGTSLPTGENGARLAGARLDEHAQIGTGAWGPYAGVLYERQREPWALGVSATARLRTENGHAYRFGSALLATLDVQHDLVARVAVGMGADVRWAAADTRSGDRVLHTGGFLVSAIPSLSVGLAAGVRVRVRAQLPLLERLRGDQRAGAALAAAVSWDAG